MAGRLWPAAKGDQVVAPIRAMLPGAVVPLEHDRFRRIARIEIDIGEELVPLANTQRRLSAVEEVLAHTLGGARAGSLAAVGGQLRLADELPWRVTLLLGARRRVIVD